MVCLLLGKGMQDKYSSRHSTLFIKVGLDACHFKTKVWG